MILNSRHERTYWILTLACVILGLFLLALNLPFDYDEVLLAHQSWLISQGLHPFRDFHSVHPPFFAYAYAPLLSILPENYKSLIVLRLINILFSIALLAALAKTAYSFIKRPCMLLPILMATEFFIVNTAMYETLIQFRRDTVSLAFLFWGYALYVADVGNAPCPRRRFAMGALFCLGCLFDVKLVLLPATALLFLLARDLRKSQTPVQTIFAPIIGFGMIGFLAVAFLYQQHIFFSEAIQSIFQFHSQLTKEFPFEYGFIASMVQKTSETPLLWGVILFSVAYGVQSLRNSSTRIVVAPLLVAVVAQLFLNKLCYRQYIFTFYVPLMLLCSIALAEWFQRNLQEQRILIGVLVLTAHVGMASGQIVKDLRNNVQDQQIEQSNLLLSLTSPNDRIVAPAPLHPIFRFDATYSNVISLTPTKKTMQELTSFSAVLSEKLSARGYHDQIRASAPSLILVTPGHQDANMHAALRIYLDGEKEHFESMPFGNSMLYVRKAMR